MTFDRIDLKILDLLQRDATLSIARISHEVGLSQTPCWKRIQKYEEEGLIQGRVALIDSKKMGFHLTAFVMVQADEHTQGWKNSFLSLVESMPQVCDIYRLTGNYDFLLRVMTEDMPSFDTFYAQLTQKIKIRSVNSFFALEAVKSSTALPLIQKKD